MGGAISSTGIHGSLPHRPSRDGRQPSPALRDAAGDPPRHSYRWTAPANKPLAAKPARAAAGKKKPEACINQDSGWTSAEINLQRKVAELIDAVTEQDLWIVSRSKYFRLQPETRISVNPQGHRIGSRLKNMWTNLPDWHEPCSRTHDDGLRRVVMCRNERRVSPVETLPTEGTAIKAGGEG